MLRPLLLDLALRQAEVEQESADLQDRHNCGTVESALGQEEVVPSRVPAGLKEHTQKRYGVNCDPLQPVWYLAIRGSVVAQCMVIRSTSWWLVFGSNTLSQHKDSGVLSAMLRPECHAPSESENESFFLCGRWVCLCQQNNS